MAKETVADIAINQELERLKAENVELQAKIGHLNDEIAVLKSGHAQLEEINERLANTVKMATENGADSSALAEENQQLKSLNEQLQEKLSRSEQSRRELVENHAETLKSIRNTVQHGGAVVIRPTEPVDGKFTAEFRDAKTGQITKKVVKFTDGHQRVRLGDGEIVGAAALMRIAEGGEANDKELKTFPALANLTKDAAAARLNDLVKMNYPHLVQVE